MKKFYTLALAAAVALGASAREVKELKIPAQVILPAKQTALNTNFKAEFNKVATLKDNKLHKAAAAEDVYGRYIWNFATFADETTLRDITGQKFFVDPSTEDGVAIITFSDYEAPVLADFEKGTLTIVPYLIQQMQDNAGKTYDFYILPMVVDDNLQLGLKESVDINIIPGGLTMDYYDGWGIGYVPEGAELTAQNISLYDVFLTNEFKYYVESDYWTNIGEATFADGFFYSFFREDKEGSQDKVMISKVEAQRSVENPNVFRLKNPFGPYMQQFYDPSYEFISEPLEVDVTDPNAVLVTAQLTGVNDGETRYIILSSSYAFDFFKGFTESQFNEWGCTYGTYADNTINFPAGSLIVYLPDVTSGGNVGVTSFTTTIELPAGWNAIDNVAVEGADAPVEYFNLQGVRVANPENGLYIRRCGKNVKKVLVK